MLACPRGGHLSGAAGWSDSECWQGSGTVPGNVFHLNLLGLAMADFALGTPSNGGFPFGVPLKLESGEQGTLTRRRAQNGFPVMFGSPFPNQSRVPESQRTAPKTSV